jgi:non-heme chloroperoxidase
MLRKAFLGLTLLLVAALALPPLWYAVFPPPAPPQLPPQGRRVEVSPGVGVNVIEQGHGPPVLLVHGHPGCAYDWALVIRALDPLGFRAIAYGRVGYGRSDARRDDRYTVDANADELLALLTALDLHDVTLVGFSYGGGVAIVAAKKDASRIGRLVLVGSVGPGIENRDQPPALVMEFMAGPGLAWISRVPPLEARFLRSFGALAFAPGPVHEGYAEVATANFAASHTLDTFRSEGRDLGGAADLDPGPIERPILIVQGDSDRLVPPFVAETLSARARNAELWLVPDGSHMLPVTHAGPLAQRIAAFASRGP